MGLILLVSLVWSAPVIAQADGEAGWRVQVEGRGGYFVPTRDIGKILGTEVQAQIRTELQPAPVYNLGFLISPPSPNYSLRGSVGFLSTDARGQSGVCAVVSGPGCVYLDVPTTAIQGSVDVLLHNDVAGSTLRYFIAGLAMRSYSFDEMECRGVLDPNLLSVCSPMMEFLADQVGLVGRLGLGFRRGVGPVGIGLEVLDQISQFVGSGTRGEGGIQNDVMFSVGVSFPGR